jgi:hypothetical protein
MKMIFLDVANTLAPNSPSIPTSVSAAIVLGYLLDTAKRLKQLPKINYYSTQLNTWLRLVLTGVATLGISWTWSAVTGGGHQWVINIPAGSVLLAGMWHWATQYGLQHGWEILLAQRPVAQKAMVAQAAGQGQAAQPQAVAVEVPKNLGI